MKETVEYILSRCPKVHLMRIRRHDSIVQLVKTACEAANLRVLCEHHIRIENRQLQKPDLIIINESTAFVVDVSIVTERIRIQGNNVDLHANWTHRSKIYDSDATNTYVRNLARRNNVDHGAIIISIHGLWCSKNDDLFQQLYIANKYRELMVVRTMGWGCRSLLVYLYEY